MGSETVWQFEKCDGLWCDMAPSFSNQLSAAVSKGHNTITFTAQLILDDQLVDCEYECDLSAMVQRNLTTSNTRKLRAIHIDFEENRGVKRGSGAMDNL